MDGGSDPLCGRFDIRIAHMRVTQGHGRIAVPEQPGDDGNRHPLQYRLAGEGVPAVMEADILETGASAHAVPEMEFARSRPARLDR